MVALLGCWVVGTTSVQTQAERPPYKHLMMPMNSNNSGYLASQAPARDALLQLARATLPARDGRGEHRPIGVCIDRLVEQGTPLTLAVACARAVVLVVRQVRAQELPPLNQPPDA
jgi:hypothetical protein